MCRTFNVLPNDPLVQALKPVQIEWINYNLRQESEVLKGGKTGMRLEDANDLPRNMFDGKEGEKKAGNFLGQQG